MTLREGHDRLCQRCHERGVRRAAVDRYHGEDLCEEHLAAQRAESAAKGLP